MVECGVWNSESARWRVKPRPSSSVPRAAPLTGSTLRGSARRRLQGEIKIRFQPFPPPGPRCVEGAVGHRGRMQLGREEGRRARGAQHVIQPHLMELRVQAKLRRRILEIRLQRSLRRASPNRDKEVGEIELILFQCVAGCGIQAQGGKGGREDRDLASLGAALRRDASALINGQSLDLQGAGPQFRRVENTGPARGSPPRRGTNRRLAGQGEGGS